LTVKKLIEKTATKEIGDKLRKNQGGFEVFGEITKRMRTQIKEFLTKDMASAVKADYKEKYGKQPTADQFKNYVESLIQSSFNATRGSLFEEFAKVAIKKSVDSDLQSTGRNGATEPKLDAGSRVLGEYQLNVKSKDGKDAQTFPDTTILAFKGNELVVTFHEYKTGLNETSSGQDALKELVATGKPNKIMAELDFSSPKSKELKKVLDDAKDAKKTIKFEYIVNEENPSGKKK
jgi:hypothetical protein